MRVKDPYEDDCRNLKQMVKYIKGKLGVKFNLRADSLSVIKWWVSTHKDNRRDTGGMMSLGAGSITSGSWKQNINGQSSTDNEIIGVNNIMGPVLWTLYLSRCKDTLWRTKLCYKTTTSPCV